MVGSERAPLLDGDAVAFLHSGVSALVATRDAGLRPEIARAWGPEPAAEGRELTLCLIAPAGSPTRANLEDNGAIAVVCSIPTTARAIQIKGAATRLAEPGPGELASAERHLEAFLEQIELIGFGSRTQQTSRVFDPESFLAVRFAIDEIYEQSPGPRAGQPL